MNVAVIQGKGHAITAIYEQIVCIIIRTTKS